MAVATVFVLSAGQIDLSLGSVVALSALVTADVVQSHGAVLGSPPDSVSEWAWEPSTGSS
jgi:ribose/xylose/arabinose/galactoside ABC-type transport system permease subunit